MSLTIPNTTIGTSWASLVDGNTPYSSGFLFLFNAPAEFSLKTGDLGGAVGSFGAPIPVAPGIFPIAAGSPGPTRQRPDVIYGVQVQQLPGSTPTTAPQVFGALFQAGEAQLTPSAQTSGLLSASGNLMAAGLVTGLVSAAGAILGGTGFTVAKAGAGTYNVTLTTPFANTAGVQVTTNNSSTIAYVPQASVTAAGFQVQTTNLAGAGADATFTFYATELV